jgi:hypothetical protein
MAALTAYRTYGDTTPWEEIVDDYDAAWALYDGSAFRIASGKLTNIRKHARLYRNTRLLFSHAGKVGDFYGAMVNQGTLATDGKRLPDGSPGAIPIDPQTGSDAGNAQLLAAVATTWDRSRWQQYMGLRPLYGSILGECLTEMIDVPSSHMVFPQTVWPGFVAGLDLNIVGDVTAYALEYPVTRVEGGRQVTFRYRKEVDKEEFRHYRDLGGQFQPWDPDGRGAVVANPYGFVPAIWDRHKLGRNGRALSAIQDTIPALYEVNSFFSQGMDYTRRTFSTPAAVKGYEGPARPTLGPAPGSDPNAWAEQQDWVPVSVQGGVEILQFDMGEAIQIVDRVRDFVLDANPEASFYHELRQMSTLTGPAVERALGDAVGRVTRARAGYDPQSIKQFQMQVAMCGFRYHDPSSEGWRANGGLSDRDRVFAPFDLTSYPKGDLDMSILDRPVVPRTDEERLELVERRERLRYPDSLVALGYEEGEKKGQAGFVLSERMEWDGRRLNAGAFGDDFTEGAE